MKTWKKALLFALCLLPVGLIGGWFMAEMTLAAVDSTLLEEAVRSAGSLEVVKAVSVASSVL